VHAPVVAITHVRVIDGTGAPAKDDQTVIIRDGTSLRWARMLRCLRTRL
jgi:hypothetical protein